MGPEFEVMVGIVDLTVFRGSAAARQIAEAMAWAKGNAAFLMAAWRRLNERHDMPGEMLPRLLSVATVNVPFAVGVRWINGSEDIVDLAAHIETYTVYRPLRDGSLDFEEFRLGEYGTDLTWNDEIDISAVTLWRLAREQAGAGRSERLSGAVLNEGRQNST